MGTTGGSGIGNDLHAVSLSASGDYAVAAESINEVAFGFYREFETPLRMYDLGDTVSAVSMAPDGSWIALAGTYSGIIRRFEVPPSTVVDVAVPIAYRILDDDIDVIANTVGGNTFSVDYWVIKPGRAALLAETWEMWAYVGGTLIPPQNAICAGPMTWGYSHNLGDGNAIVTGTRQIAPPQCLESSISSVDLFLLHSDLDHQPSSTELADDSATLAAVQFGVP
jgi:hypothetical protein